MLLPKRQYFPGVCSWICPCNQSDALLGCKQTHLYSGVFLRYPELNSISETWEKHPQPCAELSEGTWTLEFHHSTMASCCSPGVQGSWLRDWTPACKALFGTDHSHGIGKVLIWEYTRLGVPYWKFGFPEGMVPWGKTLPMPQDILFCVGLCFRPSGMLSALFGHQKLFQRAFRQVATYYSGSKSGCTCWLPQVPSTSTGGAVGNNPP